MIEGIEILSQEPIMECTFLGLKIFAIGGLFCIVVGVLLEALYFQDNSGLLLAICGVLICLLIGVLIDANYGIFAGKYEYKVIVDNHVSMAEFYEYYEVVDQDGKIFIIREKENVDG